MDELALAASLHAAAAAVRAQQAWHLPELRPRQPTGRCLQSALSISPKQANLIVHGGGLYRLAQTLNSNTWLACIVPAGWGGATPGMYTNSHHPPG